jgi:hypothetical protein
VRRAAAALVVAATLVPLGCGEDEETAAPTAPTDTAPAPTATVPAPTVPRTQTGAPVQTAPPPETNTGGGTKAPTGTRPRKRPRTPAERFEQICAKNPSACD